MPLPSVLDSLNCASGKSSSARRRNASTNKKSKSRQSSNEPYKRHSANDISPSAPLPPGASATPEHHGHAASTHQHRRSSKPTNETQFRQEAKIASVESLNDAIDNGESFWDLEGYKGVLKRTDNGNKLGSELADMINDRAKIEDNYAKALKQWNIKWNEHLKNDSDEYCTTKEAWKAFLEAGDRTAEIHLDMCKALINKPVFKVKSWQKEKYQRHIINFKQTKDFEDKFEEAQKPWEKYYDKLNKNKKEYYDSIKKSRSCNEAARSAESNPKYNDDYRRKLRLSAEQAERDVERARKRYEEVIKEMELYRPRYIENMKEVFEKTQTFEQERMIFFKQIFLECQSLLQVHNDERLDKVFADLLDNLNKMNPKQDLDWWGRHYGPGMAATWPEYEEYQD
jgi:protein kinase C and casein kinase substrate in neurons protein